MPADVVVEEAAVYVLTLLGPRLESVGADIGLGRLAHRPGLAPGFLLGRRIAAAVGHSEHLAPGRPGLVQAHGARIADLHALLLTLDAVAHEVPGGPLQAGRLGWLHPEREAGEHHVEIAAVAQRRIGLDQTAHEKGCQLRFHVAASLWDRRG